MRDEMLFALLRVQSWLEVGFQVALLAIFLWGAYCLWYRR